MTIVVNGKPREVPAATSVAELVQSLGIGDERIAVEYNRDILDGADYGHTTLQDGDTLEIVRFVGGG